mgnify:FL=1
MESDSHMMLGMKWRGLVVRYDNRDYIYMLNFFSVYIVYFFHLNKNIAK